MAKNRRKFTQCPNCGYTFEEVNNYCPNCGQENHDLNVPVKHLIWEFLEGTLHYDTKFWITLKYLLFRPGLLTEKFNQGQRASYVPPFRLYVFVSLVFFFTLAIGPGTLNFGQLRTREAAAGAAPGVAVLGDSAQAEKKIVEVKNAAARLDSALAATADSPIEAKFDEMFSRLENRNFNEELVREKWMKNISFGMFLLMPLFGYLLYLAYYRLKRNYVEHLMFSIHVHSFFFIASIIYMALDFVLAGSVSLQGWLLLLMLVYTYLAMLRVYKQSVWRTLFKFIPVVFIYVICLSVSLLSALFISLLMS